MSPTETYLSFFSTLAAKAPLSLFAVYLLGMLRLGPTVAFAPFFGTRVPSAVKMGMLLAFSVVLLPNVVTTASSLVLFNAAYIGLAIKELAIGFVLAFFVSVPFYIAQSSGITIDFLRGASSLQVTDPSTMQQSSDLGVLYNFVLIALFYEMNGLYYYFSAFFESYVVIPVNQWLPAGFFQFHSTFWQDTWGLVNKIFSIAIQLASPSILAILMTQLFLGIANRLAPQVQIVFLGMSLQSLVGLGLLWVAWYFILQQVSKQTMSWLEHIMLLVKSVGMG